MAISEHMPRLARIADKFDSSGRDGLAALGCEIKIDAEVTAEGLPAVLGAFDPAVVIVRSKKVTRGAINAARSLRLIVFDRVPWPRPTILHRARKAGFGGTDYDDGLTRLRLKQAFGRLIRRSRSHFRAMAP